MESNDLSENGPHTLEIVQEEGPNPKTETIENNRKPLAVYIQETKAKIPTSSFTEPTKCPISWCRSKRRKNNRATYTRIKTHLKQHAKQHFACPFAICKLVFEFKEERNKHFDEAHPHYRLSTEQKSRHCFFELSEMFGYGPPVRNRVREPNEGLKSKNCELK